MRIRLEGCARGGRRSAVTRRDNARRAAVEHAIAYQRRTGTYDRDSASKIARYVGVSARYVRMLAKKAENKGK